MRRRTGRAVQRGDLYRLRKPAGDTKRSRVMLVVSRNVFVESPFSTVICAPVYSADRALETEVLVGVDEGLKHSSVVTCDALLSVQKRQLTGYVGSLGPVRLVELDRALRVALALEEDSP